jgi:hypothetical protein
VSIVGVTLCSVVSDFNQESCIRELRSVTVSQQFIFFECGTQGRFWGRGVTKEPCDTVTLQLLPA